MAISRRGFLGAMLAAAVAPAIVRPASLMKIWVPTEPKILTLADFADGETDATAFIQDMINKGGIISLVEGTYKLSRSLIVTSGVILDGNGAILRSTGEEPAICIPLSTQRRALKNISVRIK